EESLAILRGLGDRVGITMALNRLGSAIARQRDLAAARALHEEALAICQRSNAKDGIAHSLDGLADVARLRGDYGASLSLCRQALAIWSEIGERPELPQSLERVAGVLQVRGHQYRAVCLWAAASALRQMIFAARPPDDAAECDHFVSAARAALGEEGFSAAWKVGQAMGTDQAVADALKDDE